VNNRENEFGIVIKFKASIRHLHSIVNFDLPMEERKQALGALKTIARDVGDKELMATLDEPDFLGGGEDEGRIG
jgi:hypothetical protein